LDRVEHSPYRATNTVTEMNFGLRSAGNGRLVRHARPGQGSTYLRAAIIRYTPRAVGLMGIENLFRYTALAVGLKPSASQGEARLRGLYRIISSKTISPRLWNAKPACAGCGGLFTQRPYALGYGMRSPPARAVVDYLLKDHQTLRCLYPLS